MKTVFVMLAEGFEEIEAISIIDVLRRADIDVVTVAAGEDLAVTGGHGIMVQADRLFRDTDFGQGSMVVLPGGGVGCDNLAAHQGLAEVLKQYAAGGKYLAAICAAPTILGRLGLLEGRRAVCYPGLEDRLTGAAVEDAAVVRDGMIITGKGPAAALAFALGLVEVLAGQESAAQAAEGLLY